MDTKYTVYGLTDVYNSIEKMNESLKKTIEKYKKEADKIKKKKSYKQADDKGRKKLLSGVAEKISFAKTTTSFKIVLKPIKCWN